MKSLFLISILILASQLSSAQCAESEGVKNNILTLETSCYIDVENEIRTILKKHLGSANKKYGYNLKDEKIKIKLIKKRGAFFLSISAPYDKKIKYGPMEKAFKEIRALPK